MCTSDGVHTSHVRTSQGFSVLHHTCSTIFPLILGVKVLHLLHLLHLLLYTLTATYVTHTEPYLLMVRNTKWNSEIYPIMQSQQ